MNTEEKLLLARQLERLGVDIIEAGFPIASEGDFEAVKLIAKEIKNPRLLRWPAPTKMISTVPGRRSREHYIHASILSSLRPIFI